MKLVAQTSVIVAMLAAVVPAQPDWQRRVLDSTTPKELVEALWEATQPMAQGVQAIEFDNGVSETGGLSLAVARAGSAYQEDGTSIGANTARYADPKLFVGAAGEPVTLSGFSGVSFRPLSSGFAADGATPILVNRNGQAQLDVHVRTDPEAYYNDSITTGTYRTTLDSNGDLLNGQTSSNGGTAAISNHAFLPGSSAVWKGYIVVGCDHLYDDGGGADSVGVALAYTTAARLEDGTNPWILEAVTESVNIGPTSHHQAWSLTKWEISDTLCVFLWTDYGTDTREGGNCQMSVLDISSGSPVWTHVRLFDEYRAATTGSITSNSAANPTVVTTGASHGMSNGDEVSIRGQSGTVSIDGNHTISNVTATTFTVPVDCTSGGGTGGTWRKLDDDQHDHCGGLIVDSSGNWIIALSRGDGQDRNRLLSRRLLAADVAAGNYGAGTTYTHGTFGATGISSSYVIENPHANWEAVQAAWGSNADAYSANHSYRHNQIISMAQENEGCTSILCGTDETSEGVLRMTWDATNNVPVFEPAYLPSFTGAAVDGVVNFGVRGHPGGPFIAKAGGGTNQWDDGETGGSGVDNLESVVMYSPDGSLWGQVLDFQEEAQYQAVQLRGTNKVFLGTSSSNTPKYFTLPPTRSASPLQIASSPANSLDSGISASTPTGASTGVTITDLATDGSDLPASFNGELPPCDRGPMVLINVTGDPSADRNHYGHWTIASGLSDSFSDIAVKVWVRAVNYDGSSYNNKATAACYFNLQQTSGPSNPVFAGGVKIFDSGAWYPVVIYATKSQFSNSGNFVSGWNLRLRLRADGLTTNTTPCTFAMCIEGVYLDGGLPASHGLAAQASAQTEVATISGITPRTTWSLMGHVMVPHDQWDCRSGGEPPGGSFGAGSSVTATPVFYRLQGIASDTFELRADLANNRIVCATDAASTNGASSKKWWRRGDSVPAVITCDGSEIVVYYETTDGAIASVTVADAITFDEIESQDPALWRRFIVKDGVDPDPEATLRSMANGYQWAPFRPNDPTGSRRRTNLRHNRLRTLSLP